MGRGRGSLKRCGGGGLMWSSFGLRGGGGGATWGAGGGFGGDSGGLLVRVLRRGLVGCVTRRWRGEGGGDSTGGGDGDSHSRSQRSGVMSGFPVEVASARWGSCSRWAAVSRQNRFILYWFRHLSLEHHHHHFSIQYPTFHRWFLTHYHPSDAVRKQSELF